MAQAIEVVKKDNIKWSLEKKITEMFGQTHISAMNFIVNNESGFRLDAVNKSSGACGLGQALPCSKMNCALSYEGLDCQVAWVSNYVKQRYGNPLNAQDFWREHRWY